jgi:Na+:H+ antiporter, NhaA family
MSKVKKYIRTPFERFLKLEAASSFLLMGCTVLAFIAASVDIFLPHGIVHWINDGLMSVFFFVVGLEIKRELLVGELSSIKKASLPIFGAIGGMLIPAGIFIFFNNGLPTAAGWGIPMATDIAFAVGIVTLLGKRVHPALKVFLLALAIVDDLGAVLVIALFYTSSIEWSMLLGGVGVLLVLVAGNKFGVRSLLFYSLIGIVVWYLFLRSGVHATIAGVLVAFTVPASAAKQEHVSPLVKFEELLHKVTAYMILPLFALANAGVQISSDSFSRLVEPLPLGIMLGLAVGKPIGITFLAWLGIRLKLASFPTGVSLPELFSISILGGIGFTMSLFITNLAFHDPIMINEAKLGIVIASLVSGVVGYLVLLRRK